MILHPYVASQIARERRRDMLGVAAGCHLQRQAAASGAAVRNVAARIRTRRYTVGRPTPAGC